MSLMYVIFQRKIFDSKEKACAKLIIVPVSCAQSKVVWILKIETHVYSVYGKKGYTLKDNGKCASPIV